MNDLEISIGILVFSVFIASISQILLKISANKTHETKLREYMNPYVMIGYGLLFVSTILTMIALKKVPLSLSPAIESCSYIFVSITGYFILKEKFNRKKLLGLALILVGILIATFGS